MEPHVKNNLSDITYLSELIPHHFLWMGRIPKSLGRGNNYRKLYLKAFYQKVVGDLIRRRPTVYNLRSLTLRKLSAH